MVQIDEHKFDSWDCCPFPFLPYRETFEPGVEKNAERYTQLNPSERYTRLNPKEFDEFANPMGYR
jgi:hypothetical protein